MRLQLAACAVLVVALAGCGGGGGGGGSSNSTTSQPAAPAVLTITTTTLPPAVVNRPYAVTLGAKNGTPPYKWTATGLPSWMSLDAASGRMSGTPSTRDIVNIGLQVTESSSPPQTAKLDFVGLVINDALQLLLSNPTILTEYSTFYLPVIATGGVGPYTYSFAGGNLPPGMKFTSSQNQAELAGAPLATGSYTFSLNVADQLTPPDTATQQVTVSVNPPILTVANSIPTTLALNRPFSGSVVATGGTPPYTFAVSAGTLPSGLTLQPNGALTGTASNVGTYSYSVRVTDAASAVAYGSFGTKVAPPLGRNDTPATATPIGNGSFQASISPYIDPPNGPPTPGDGDYYLIQVMPGSTLHVETYAKRNNPGNPLDTVLELVDGNRVRLSTCRLPGDTSASFTASCIDDDISSSPHVQDSALDFQLAGNPTGPQTVYAHLLDWRGDARPDMTYGLQVNGAFDPITFKTILLPVGAVGVSYYETISVTGGTGQLTGTVSSGQLPPGMSIVPSSGNSSYMGIITGAPTGSGTYTFSLQIADQATPPQVVTRQFTIAVNTQVQITLLVPSLQVGHTYTLYPQVSGGIAPYSWGYLSPYLSTIAVDSATGVVTIMPTTTGNFSFTLTVTDAGPPVQVVWKSFNVTVNP